MHMPPCIKIYRFLYINHIFDIISNDIISTIYHFVGISQFYLISFKIEKLHREPFRFMKIRLSLSACSSTCSYQLPTNYKKIVGYIAFVNSTSSPQYQQI